MSMKKTVQKVLIPAGFWLILWTLAAELVRKELLLPAPAAVFRTLLDMGRTKEFWQSVWMSLGRIGLGFLLGAVLGTALGVVTAALRWGDSLLSPAVRAVRTIPVVSFILLLYFWLPTGRVPTAVAALMVLPVVWRATRQGIAGADPQLLELAKAYRLGWWRTLIYVYVPAVQPALSAGWETGLGLAWKAGVAAEVLCQPKWAMGTELQISKAYLDSPGLFAWTAVVVGVSIGTEWLLSLLLRKWRGGLEHD